MSSLAANALRPFPIAIVLTNNTAAITEIATNAVAVLWFFTLVIYNFISQVSAMLYLRCFTSSAKNMVEFVDTLDL
jgi:hypothetical protein